MDYKEKSEFIEDDKQLPSIGTIAKKAGRRKRRSTLKFRKVTKKRFRRTIGRKRIL